MGVNAAGLSSKLHSFDNILKEMCPSVFFIEETKMRMDGKIKTENTSKYQIFERVRKSGRSGGGLALGVHHDLSPVWVGEGESEVETLSVEISVKSFKIRCVAAYGPQETGPSVEIKNKFWSQLDAEVAAAENADTGFILQMDENVWAGPHLIPGDPNTQNSNGKLFEQFLQRNPHLTLVNSLQLCEGLITRMRVTKTKVEKAVLDIFVVCDKIRPFLTKMVIDESREYVLTNFNPIRIGGKAIESDHNTEFLKLGLQYDQKKTERIEVFNLKNVECQEVFLSKTSQTERFTECFNSNQPLEDQAVKWKKTLDSFCHQSFKKVRVNFNKPKVTKISELLDERKSLKQMLKNCDNEDNCSSFQQKIEDIDQVIAQECSEENYLKIKENFELLSNKQDSMNTPGMWAIMRKVFPKNSNPPPVAKRDGSGCIITSPEALKKLYQDTYVNRLRHRPIKEDFSELKKLKETLFSLRLVLCKQTKSKPWTESDLNKVLKNLKKNKSRDPHGLLNDLFKPGVIGSNLYQSLLVLLNEIKDKCHIPEFMQWANITSLYKGKGGKLDLESERGIFIVTVLRSILMRLIYNDKYEVIDSNMSDSNIGARKAKNIRNHIFVVNGIIHEALSSKKSTPVDIQIGDYRQCFDGMWLAETLNDMYRAGVQDDHLALLYQANKKVNVSVKTPIGMTDRFSLEEIILQGDVFGPIECSVTVDSFGKECLNENKHLYYYKDSVPVPLLTMVDDVIAVTECGYKSSMMNAFLNTKTNIKKLQYGVKKCFKMHVGRTCNKEVCPDLYVDGWEIAKVKEVETGVIKVKEVNTGEHEMAAVESEKYLGDILSNDGKNLKNVTARKNKGTGIVTQILGKLSDICFGKHYFKVAIILRNSHLISSLLTNAEAWYNVTQSDIDLLESVDENLLRRILECPMSTPKEMLYLELGVIPIRYIMKMRRLNFLQYILQEDNKSLIHSFLQAQLEKPTKGDWAQSCIATLKELEIDLDMKEIKDMKITRFRNLVRRNTTKVALNNLNQIKLKHSKVLHIEHNKMEMQKYFVASNLCGKDKKFIFALRCRMVEVKHNFKEKYLNMSCPCCEEDEDTQEHLLTCPELETDGEVVMSLPDYGDLFGRDLVKQIDVARLIMERYQKRKKKIATQMGGPSDPTNMWLFVVMYY